ncbi:hypothetical protein [Vibrio marisflavi]|uniref:Uncharacterized protein n=1 Tax=Vibrio marisflavi CECT 7928 TaxID=634439 RepID=A0ABN8E2V4_9VIBR|nr:hypothetical protein [Vibrio marisflavi]CAH0536810.1 hypothetical protein VMF7928_00700 [Vibrio marisflavi CECT 7928]
MKVDLNASRLQTYEAMKNILEDIDLLSSEYTKLLSDDSEINSETTKHLRDKLKSLASKASDCR